MGFFSSAAAAAIRFSGTGRTALQRLAVPSATRPIARSLCGAPAPAPTLRLDPVLEGVISRFKKSAARASSDETSLVEVFSKLQVKMVLASSVLCESVFPASIVLSLRLALEARNRLGRRCRPFLAGNH
eukprot:6184484-Pleurochrysis_carterae.AAC.3